MNGSIHTRAFAGLVWLAALLPAQQALFVPFEGEANAAAVEVVLGDLRIAIDDGRLVVGDPGATRPLPCTHPEGTGEVHALACTGFGQCVAAADQGLFVLDAQHLVADLADLRDGVPRGRMLGAVAMDDGRLFVCTADQFGVVDLRFGYGFTFGERQAVPPGPFTGLRRQGRGLVLQTAAGGFGYLPDRGAGPVPAGGAVERGERDVVFGEAPKFDPAVEAGGEVRLRARRAHHHLVLPLQDGQLEGLRPGQHTVHVFAVDRDLRRRRVGVYDVRVRLPQRFSTRWLPAVAGAVLIAVALLAWPRRGRRRIAHTLLRAGLLGVLGLQVVAALLGYGRSWPFMGFSMYTETYREGSLLYKPQVLGIRDDGSTVPLIDWDLGLRQDGYWQVLSEVAYGSEQRLSRHLGILTKRRPHYRVTGLRFTDTRIRLTRDGPVDVAPVILRDWSKP